ncbi:MAG: TolC family protein [Lentimicrobiaceae bacterium]|nr:TolC family protein [Lentimicrobiaceae bacterium]
MNAILKIYLLIIFFSFSVNLTSQVTGKLTLDEAVEMALNENKLIKISQQRIIGSEAKLSEMKSNYFPRIVLESVGVYNSDPNLYINKGQLNNLYDQLVEDEIIDDWLKENAPLPPRKITFLGGNDFAVKSNAAIYQPLTQLTSINTGRKVAELDVEISKLNYDDVKSQIRLGVKELFYGILIQDAKVNEASQELEYKKAEYQDAVNAYEAGEMLLLDVTSAKAEIFEAEQDLLNEENLKDQYIYSFNQLIGAQYSYKPDLVLPTLRFEPVGGIQEYYIQGSEKNYGLKIALANLDKSELGITAAKKAYIPELSYFAQYYYNYGIPLYASQYLLTGLNFKWTLIDFGERSSVVKQRNAIYNEALDNLEYKKLTLQGEIQQAYRNISYAESLILTALKAYEAREEELILTINAVEAGEALSSMMYKAKADIAGAKADKLAAELNYQIAVAKLNSLVGE